MHETKKQADSYGDVSLRGEGHLVEIHGELVVLPEPEMQLVASLVRAQGRAVRRTVLEMKAWGIWGAAGPAALANAIQRLRAELALLGSAVRISGTPDTGFALTTSA